MAEFYEESSPLVYGMALRILSDAADAEEVTLDVYTQVWRTAASFNASRGNAATWLVTIARSRSIDRFRSRADRIRREHPIVGQQDAPDPAEKPEEASFVRQRRRIVKAALAELPREQRQLIEMAFFSDMSHSQLASRTGLPLGTIKTRIRLGMMRLRELLAPLRLRTQ